MSNSPTPTAQDGERERLIADMTTLIPVAARSVATRIAKTIRTQSAELAALRAQVEGLRKLLKLARTAINEEVQAGGLEHPTIAAHARVLRKIDAALAPPQPVAKETKP
jgi:hypothetical protein